MSQNRSINIVTSYPPNGGVSDYAQTLSEVIATSYPEAEVTVWSYASLYPSFLIKDVQNVRDLKSISNLKVKPVLKWWNIFSALTLPFRMEGNSVNIQYWSPATIHLLFPLALVARLMGKKVVITVHNPKHHEQVWKVVKPEGLFARTLNNFVGFAVKSLITAFLALGTQYVAHNENSRVALAKSVGEKKKIELIPHPIITVYPSTEKSPTKYREQLGLPADRRVILHFGNVRKYKGLEDAAAAFKKLDPQKNHLLIAGRIWDDMKPFIKELKRSDQSENITVIDRFINFEELPVIFGASDLLLISHKEFASASGVLTLGVYYNLPIVASAIFRNESYVDRTVETLTMLDDTLIEDIIENKLDKRNYINKVNGEVAQLSYNLFSS